MISRHLICSSLFVLGSMGSAFANDSVLKATGDAKNWAIFSGDYGGTRYSSLDQINAPRT